MIRPFIKWAGGKRQILKQILKRIPVNFNRYFEPFVGGGALLFAINSEKSIVSDVNDELISAYIAIKDTPEELMDKLDEHEKNNSEKYYYCIRDNFYVDNIIDVAARFIYMNKACFNGLYRVNKKGRFNVPFGKKENIVTYERENILGIHEYLKNVSIYLRSFDCINPDEGDFVYVDPPYHNQFSWYSCNGFTEKDHIVLAEFVRELVNKGVYVMVSNSDTEFIRNLYNGFNIEVIESIIKIDGKPRKNNELLITCY